MVPHPYLLQKGNPMTTEQRLVAHLAREDFIAGRIDIACWLNSAVYRTAYAQEREDLATRPALA